MLNKKRLNYNKILQSIQINVAGMKIALPKEISVGTFSITAKIPFKVHSLREALYHRVSNLSDVTLNLLLKSEYVPSLILIRSIMECTAVMFYLDKFVRKCISDNKIGDFDDRVMKLIFGSKDGTTSLQAMNILTIIDHWNKDTPIIRQIYDDLSEFAHPNWSGVDGSYVKIDKKRLIARFKKITDKNSKPYELALVAFDSSIRSFIYFYDGIAEFLKKFAELCEAEIKKNDEEK